MRREQVLGAVLAGGQSRRFGSDKAQAVVGGRTMLDAARALLPPFVAEVVVIGGGRAGIDAVPDAPAPGLGPLGGLCGALLHARARGYQTVLSVPCDTPDLPAEALAALLDAGAPAYLEALPVAGLWLVQDAAAMLAHLGSGGERSMRGWTRVCGAVPVRVEASWRNVNRVEDLSKV